jgi:hypothetical protein
LTGVGINNLTNMKANQKKVILKLGKNTIAHLTDAKIQSINGGKIALLTTSKLGNCQTEIGCPTINNCTVTI